MIKVKKEGTILSKTDFDFENEAVLNPAVIREGDLVHLFYRAVKKGNYSTLGYCKLNGPLKIEERFKYPVLIPQNDYESQGLEDPRIVKIDDMYYLTYSAFDGENALGALACSKDLKHFDKHGPIVRKIKKDDFRKLDGTKGKLTNKYFTMNSGDGYLMNKDVVFFPRRINNKLCFLQRIKPDIQIVFVNNLNELTEEFWEDYFLHLDEKIMMSPRYSHELCYIGSGCPPIETKEGWLLIFHGVQEEGYLYSARAALFDLENPQKEIARLPYKLFKPHEEYESKGIVDKVCFPTGTTLFDDTLYIYYGAADEQIACASLSLSELITELLNYAQK